MFRTYQYESTRIKIDSPRNRAALSWRLHDLRRCLHNETISDEEIQNRWLNSNDPPPGLGIRARTLARPKFISRAILPRESNI